jgi:spore coat polysaccharide biosynthesis protein SpsF
MTGIFGLVQARMGSTRLPGKVLKPLAGKPLIGHIFDRLKVLDLEGIVLSTTQDRGDDDLADYARSQDINIYRGPRPDDLAERLYGAAASVGAHAVLNVHSDCPMIDPALLSELLRVFRADHELDYCSNKITFTYPEGLSAEVIATRALEWCSLNLVTAADREFVANWIKDHTGIFKVASVVGPRDLTRYKWSVDTPSDYEEVTAIFEACYPADPLFGLNEILAHVSAKE